jgi:hypothetical protein
MGRDIFRGVVDVSQSWLRSEESAEMFWALRID